MNGIIVYKGKYGATLQYADFLGSSLQVPIVMSDNVQASDLKKFDYVILGSAVYIGKLLIREWIRENIETLQSKKLFIFIVCGTSPDNKEKLEPISRENIPEEIRNRCEIYFLHGRMNKKKLSFWDSILLKMGSIFTKDPVEKMNMLKDFDAVRIENLFPLINAVSAYKSKRFEPALS
ncbi:MAG: flavodoxin domain-containing protein [Chitinophagales bacterium]